MSGRARLVAITAIVLCAGGLGAALVYAAFVATTSNSGNSFQAASCFSTQRVSSGSYTGNAVDGRAIATSFQPDLVIVKADTAQIAVSRSSSMAGDVSKPMSGATALVADRIQSLTASGFTVGANAQVNGSGTSYRWVALRAGCGTLKVGSYTGNGSGQAITGAGFRPEQVTVLGAGGTRAVQRFSGMTTSFLLDSGTGIANAISSLDANGFTVGAAAEANTNGATYHYVAFNDVPGSVKAGTYTGNGTDNRNLTGVGFPPQYLMIRANDTVAARSGHHRPASLTGTGSLFWANTANSSNGIKALQADGFQLGTDASVNANSVTYHYLAFGNASGGCPLPSSQTLTASADSWLDQASPAINRGADSVLRVTSKSSNLNTRAMVRFALPALPSGCSVTAATLRLYNKSPIAGRTLEALRNSATWTENGVTWTNQPATAGTAATATTPGAAGWMQWNVQSQVQAMYPSSSFGFKVRDQTENGASIEQQFDSRESGAYLPQLIVDIG